VAAGRDFEFANDLIREALYATTPEPIRLAYHRRAADLLTSQPESLARHAAAAGDWPRAARALLSAADEAFGRFAVTDSAALAIQALEAAERAGDREAGARARVIRGRAHEAMAAVPAALADFSEGAAAARAVGDRRLEMLALRQLGGDVPVAHGMPIGYCESHLAEGLRLAELLGDQAAAADLLARLAIIATNQVGEHHEIASAASTTAAPPCSASRTPCPSPAATHSEHKPARPPSGSSLPMPASPDSAAPPKHRSTSSTRPAHSPVPAQRARALHGARAPGLRLLRVSSVAQASRHRHALARQADLQEQGKVTDAGDLADRSLFT